MNESLPWVVFILTSIRLADSSEPTKHADSSELVGRGLGLTSLAKSCCLAEAHNSRSPAVQGLWPANVFCWTTGEKVAGGIARCLNLLRLREPKATVILIPFNHCAVEGVSWTDSVNGAVKLANVHTNAVYLLHDSPDNDPRVARVKPPMCSSSVLIGSVSALQRLAVEDGDKVVVELSVDDLCVTEVAPITTASTDHEPGVGVVHIRLVEEYARLQREDVWHRAPRQVDVRA